MTNTQPPIATPTSAVVAEIVESYVRSRGAVEDTEELDRDVHLFDEGYLDSLGTLGLISLLEETYSTVLPGERLLDPRFSSVNGIADLVSAVLI